MKQKEYIVMKLKYINQVHIFFLTMVYQTAKLATIGKEKELEMLE